MSEVQVLDLAAVFKRDTVKMPDGGDTLEMRNPQEFGIIDEHRLQALLERINKFQDGAKSEQEAEEASKLLRELAAMIVIDCPDTIADWACVAVFQFWMERATKDAPADPPKPRRRTTAASSRGSKPSTAATPKTGSAPRRGR